MVRLGKKTDEQDRKHWRCWEEGGLRWSILSHLVDGAFQLPMINTLRGGSKIGLGKKSYKLPPLRHCLQVKFKVFFLIKKKKELLKLTSRKMKWIFLPTHNFSKIFQFVLPSMCTVLFDLMSPVTALPNYQVCLNQFHRGLTVSQ